MEKRVEKQAQKWKEEVESKKTRINVETGKYSTKTNTKGSREEEMG